LEADGNMYAVAKQARVIAAFPRIFPIPWGASESVLGRCQQWWTHLLEDQTKRG
jgi:hypothetical protein